MKHKYLLLLTLSCFSLVKGYSQNCTSLGCAANYGAQTIDATVPNVLGDPTNCYTGVNYKQAFWQFFYSPTGGDFTQTYTPTHVGDIMDLDYIVFDMGLSGPVDIMCPIDPSSFTEVLCGNFYTPDIPTGPGLDGTITTVAGHFYAVVVYFYQIGVDPFYTFNIGNPQIGGVNLNALNCPGVLPVKLSSFDAIANNCNIRLEWIAETESQFKHYEVEFSTDGNRFKTIATLAGQGINKKYTYNHANPVQGKIFYRLKMKDLDGRIEYSKIIALHLDCNGSSVLTYPNPVIDHLNINIIHSNYELTTAGLYDSNGKLVYSGTMKNGTNRIDMTKFAKGVYVLKLRNSEGTQNIKVIK